MKTILLAAIVCVTLICGTSLVMAASNVVLDRVDIGTETEEQWAGMSGWNPEVAEPPPPVDNSRVIWYEADPEDDPCATITLGRGVSRGAATALRIRHLDGVGDDSFDVYVRDVHGDWVCIGSYAADDDIDSWVISEFALPNGQSLQLGRGGHVEVQLCATGDKWAQFEEHGQVQVDWIELIGNGAKVK
jgi:hypothetical protein